MTKTMIFNEMKNDMKNILKGTLREIYILTENYDKDGKLKMKYLNEISVEEAIFKIDRMDFNKTFVKIMKEKRQFVFMKELQEIKIIICD